MNYQDDTCCCYRNLLVFDMFVPYIIFIAKIDNKICQNMTQILKIKKIIGANV
jgi:hypothetical protein